MGSMLGVDGTVIKWFTSNGIWGMVGLIVLIVGKLWVIPAITKFLSDYMNMGSNVVTTLEGIRGDIQSAKNDARTAFHNQQRISEKIDILLGENIGELDDKLALHIFADIMYKYHYMALAFYNIRIINNGIHTSRELIIGRYTRKSDEISNKIMTDLQYFYHNKVPLSHFFSADVKSYYRHLFNALFNLQEIYNGEAPLEDIEASLEANIMKLLAAFKTWLGDKKYTYNNARRTYDFELFPPDIVIKPKK